MCSFSGSILFSHQIIINTEHILCARDIRHCHLPHLCLHIFVVFCSPMCNACLFVMNILYYYLFKVWNNIKYMQPHCCHMNSEHRSLIYECVESEKLLCIPTWISALPLQYCSMFTVYSVDHLPKMSFLESNSIFAAYSQNKKVFFHYMYWAFIHQFMFPYFSLPFIHLLILVQFPSHFLCTIVINLILLWYM